MAITSTITIEDGVQRPSGYTPAVITPIANPVKEVFETDIAITEADAADPSQGLDNVIAAVKAFFDSDYAVNTLKLDIVATITARLHILSIKRVNTASSIYLTGTEVFRCKVEVHYN